MDYGDKPETPSGPNLRRHLAHFYSAVDTDPTKWSGLSHEFERLLRFLTGDRWRLFFRARPKRLSSIVKPTDKLPLDGLDEICLFSGGLDSMIGAIDLLKAGRRPLLVSHYWDAETSKAQA